MHPPISKIKNAVAIHCGIPLAMMESPNRERRFAHPRIIAMALCRRLTLRSLPEIGRQFGNRHHTTVMSAMRRVSRLPELGNIADEVARQFATNEAPEDWRFHFHGQMCAAISIGDALRGIA